MLADNNIGLVYGGAKIGIMGAVADGVLSNGGEVIGVIPTFLSVKEVAHDGLTELIEVETMHQRKTKMNQLCDGVIALPGGFGTLEELFEMLTWAQLGLHRKPIGLLNTDGFYSDLVAMIQNMVAKGFVQPLHQNMLQVSGNIDDLIRRMQDYKPPLIDKWITEETL